MNEFKIKRTEFVELIRLAEAFTEHCQIHVNGDEMKVFCLTTTYKIRIKANCSSVISNLKINIPDVIKFLKVLRLIKVDDLTLYLERDKIFYKDNDINFVYHLADDILFKNQVFDDIKMDNAPFDVSFPLSITDMKKIGGLNSVVNDKTKIYFSCINGDDNMKIFVGDKKIAKTNNISFTHKLPDSASKTIEPFVPYELFTKIPSNDCIAYITDKYIKIEIKTNILFTIAMPSIKINEN